MAIQKDFFQKIIDGKFYIKEPIELSCSLYFDDGTCTSEKTLILFNNYIEIIDFDKSDDKRLAYIILTYDGKKYIYWFFSGNIKLNLLLSYYDNRCILRDKKLNELGI
jgi:hypothetical protein